MIYFWVLDLHDCCDFVASVFARRSAVEQLFARQAVVQKHVSIMELAVWMVDFQRNIGSSFFKISLYRGSNFFIAPLLAENVHTRVLRNSA